MIYLTPPATSEDRTLVIDMACDYTDEQLHRTGKLPSASILTADTLTLIARKDARAGSRPVGLLATATSTAPEDGPYSEIHALYVHPKWRGKGICAAMIAEFCLAAPYQGYLRGPMPPAMQEIAEALGIPHADVNDVCMLDMVTSAFLNTVGCTHAPEPCRSCVHSSLRRHLTQAYDAMYAQLDERQPTT